MMPLVRYLTAHVVVRYIVSGGTAAVVNLLSFTLFWHVLSIHSVWASIGASFVAFWTSFFMQKYFTFAHRGAVDVRIVLRYFLAFIISLGVTASLFSILIRETDIAILAQFLAAGTTAAISFFIYRHFVFQEPVQSDTPIRS